MTGNPRNWLALALLALAVAAPGAQAAEIRDEAGMFGGDAKREAERSLAKFEREYQVPVLIETVDGLKNRGESAAERRRQINNEAAERDRAWGNKGIFILIDKRDHLISEPLVPGWLSRHVQEGSRRAIRESFIAGFRQKDFDGGLVRGVKQIGEELSAAQAEAGGSLHRPGRQAPQPGGRAFARPGLPGPAAPVGQVRRGGSGIAPWIAIFLVIFGIFLVIRLLGGLFGGAARGAGGPGYGGAPGVGGYGYGGGGGGFWQSMLGGIGGAMAGNWLYDRFSGRHYEPGGYHEAGAGSYDPGSAGGPADDEIVGANDDGGQGGDWGGGGGGDWGGGGGGDWGGGGGGDWGGGGGDGGGGGGDW